MSVWHSAGGKVAGGEFSERVVLDTTSVTTTEVKLTTE